MAKQKMVLNLSMEDDKKRAKAMRYAVGVRGVVSASHAGNKLTVVGEGIDSVALTVLLRKKIGPVKLETLEEVKEKKEEKNEVKLEVKSTIDPFIWTMTQPSAPMFVGARDPFYDHEPSCNIM